MKDSYWNNKKVELEAKNKEIRKKYDSKEFLKQFSAEEINVFEKVCKNFGVELTDVFLPIGNSKFSTCRNLICKWYTKHTDKTLRDIAKVTCMKPRAHCHVTKSIQSINNLIEYNDKVKIAWNEIKDIKAPSHEKMEESDLNISYKSNPRLRKILSALPLKDAKYLKQFINTL